MIIHHFILGGVGTLFSNNPKPVPCRFHGLEITRVAKYKSERVQLRWLQWLYWSCLKFWKSKIPYLEVQFQWTKWMYFTTSWKTVAFSLPKTSGLPLKQPKKLMNMIMEFQNTYTNVKMVPSFKVFKPYSYGIVPYFHLFSVNPYVEMQELDAPSLRAWNKSNTRPGRGHHSTGRQCTGMWSSICCCVWTQKQYERYMKGIWKVYVYERYMKGIWKVDKCTS